MACAIARRGLPAGIDRRAGASRFEDGVDLLGEEPVKCVAADECVGRAVVEDCSITCPRTKSYHFGTQSCFDRRYTRGVGLRRIPPLGQN